MQWKDESDSSTSGVSSGWSPLLPRYLWTGQGSATARRGSPSHWSWQWFQHQGLKSQNHCLKFANEERSTFNCQLCICQAVPLKLGQEKELVSPYLNCSINLVGRFSKWTPGVPRAPFRGWARWKLFSYLSFLLCWYLPWWRKWKGGWDC